MNILAGLWYFLKRYRFGNVPSIRISNDINLFSDEFIKIRGTESFIIFLRQNINKILVVLLYFLKLHVVRRIEYLFKFLFLQIISHMKEHTLIFIFMYFSFLYYFYILWNYAQYKNRIFICIITSFEIIFHRRFMKNRIFVRIFVSLRIILKLIQNLEKSYILEKWHCRP